MREDVGGGFHFILEFALLVCVKVCGDIFIHAAIYIQYSHCAELSCREVGVGGLKIL